MALNAECRYTVLHFYCQAEVYAESVHAERRCLYAESLCDLMLLY
jgi:hypothetical protein